jgi:O-antigen/teichoic acid export membrane protein
MFAWASTLASALIWARPEIAFVKHFWGNEAVGLYSVGYTIASLAAQGPALLTTGLMPYFSENAGEERRAEIVKMMNSGTRLLAFVILPMCFVTAALVPILVPLLYGQDFAGAVPATMILVASAALLGNMAVLSTAIAGMERSDLSFGANLAGAALMLGICAILVPHFGILGAALARAFIQFFLLCTTIWFVTRWLGYQLPYSHLLRLVLAAAISALVAHLVISRFPSGAGMAMAGVAAGSVYLMLVRLLRALHPADVDRVKRVLDKLPEWVRWYIMSVLLRLVPRRQ